MMRYKERNILKKYSTFVVLLIWSSVMWGQSFVWQIPLSDYTQVKALTQDLLQVFRGSRFGIIRIDGTEVAPVEYDEMVGFYEHKALLLKNESSKQRIGGYLTDAGRFVAFQQAYYTLNGQAFFSDGMLSVADVQGRLGYVNESGILVLGFNGKYTRIKPFSEGHAAVFEGKHYKLIDKEGDEAQFIIGFGEVQGGTNVCNGSAIIWDTDGRFYSYQTSNQQCSRIGKQKNLQLDYLYCFAGISGRSKNVPLVELAYSFKSDIFKMMPNGMYGVNENGHQVLPGQFSSVSALSDELFIVCLGGKYGVLRKVSGGGIFQLRVPQIEITYKAGNNAQCDFELLKPEAWIAKDLNVSIRNTATGESQEGNLQNGFYRFKYQPHSAEQSFDIRVYSEGLLLLDESIAYRFKRVDPTLKVRIDIAGDIANKDNQIPVTAIISNPSDESVTATIHMTGSSTFVEKHLTVTIPAGGTERVHSCFHITKDVKNQSVQVTTSKGGSASRTGLNFESYL